MQRRLHSPLSPSLLEKQFPDGYKENNMSTVSLEIISLYKLEKGKKNRKERQDPNQQNMGPSEGISKTSTQSLKGSCLFWQGGGQKSPSLAEKLWRAPRLSVKSPFFFLAIN